MAAPAGRAQGRPITAEVARSVISIASASSIPSIAASCARPRFSRLLIVPTRTPHIAAASS